MAVGAVWCEPVSGAQFPDPQGKYREFTRNRLSGDGRFSSPGRFLGSYVACFPEFENREISAVEQGIPRCELRKLLVTAEK